MTSTGGLTERRVRLAHGDEVDPAWNARRPELAFAVNAVSLLMPYAEPYFVRAVRGVAHDLDEPLRSTAVAFCAQEARHHGEHRRFNDRLTVDRPGLVRVEGWARRSYGWLDRTRSTRFSLAFAAASETIAFSIARWADRHDRVLFDGVEPSTAALFRWHLAEEVEHKSVAHDVYEAVDGSRLRYALAAFTTLSLLAWFTVLAVLAQLWGSRWRWSPLPWLRLVPWAVSIGFVTVPNLVVASFPGHHPRDFTDPPGLVTWLRYFDPATGTVPLLEGDLPDR
ncbi:metal-dependent hydrolase [Rhabdothermincola salaria]|uniref:metal-dependent hydrolase n=1 Tax=Rhabdothermincola salaria TaxID=2903142 RepID=UPI001E4C663E|nr:metal-dependent hydrolase [Rhabdothermincola salaria]